MSILTLIVQALVTAPGMNGIELYDRLHINLELAAIPAVLITANQHVPQQQIRQRQLITFRKDEEEYHDDANAAASKH